MEYTRAYQGRITNFRGLFDVRTRFLEMGAFDVSSESYQVTAPEHTVEYESLDELLTSRFLVEATSCFFYVSAGDSRLSISGSSWDQPSLQTVRVSTKGLNEADAESLGQYICNTLQIATIRQPRLSTQHAAAFVGYSFDGAGREVADFVQRFLELIGFDVVTGEPFQAERVSEKVRELIRGQGVAVCIFTKREGGDAGYSEWVRDEATFAAALEKPLFILVERGIDRIPGIQGDLEYISFDPRDLGPLAIKLLQGLRSAGFDISTKSRPSSGEPVEDAPPAASAQTTNGNGRPAAIKRSRGLLHRMGLRK